MTEETTVERKNGRGMLIINIITVALALAVVAWQAWRSSIPAFGLWDFLGETWVLLVFTSLWTQRALKDKEGSLRFVFWIGALIHFGTTAVVAFFAGVHLMGLVPIGLVRSLAYVAIIFALSSGVALIFTTSLRARFTAGWRKSLPALKVLATVVLWTITILIALRGWIGAFGPASRGKVVTTGLFLVASSVITLIYAIVRKNGRADTLIASLVSLVFVVAYAIGAAWIFAQYPEWSATKQSDAELGIGILSFVLDALATVNLMIVLIHSPWKKHVEKVKKVASKFGDWIVEEFLMSQEAAIYVATIMASFTAVLAIVTFEMPLWVPIVITLIGSTAVGVAVGMYSKLWHEYANRDIAIRWAANVLYLKDMDSGQLRELILAAVQPYGIEVLRSQIVDGVLLTPKPSQDYLDRANLGPRVDPPVRITVEPWEDDPFDFELDELELEEAGDEGYLFEFDEPPRKKDDTAPMRVKSLSTGEPSMPRYTFVPDKDGVIDVPPLGEEPTPDPLAVNVGMNVDDMHNPLPGVRSVPDLGSDMPKGPPGWMDKSGGDGYPGTGSLFL